jgi:hypothetical protein
LFGQNQKKAVEELAFVEVGQVGDIDVFHTDEKIKSTGCFYPKNIPGLGVNSQARRK